jgi:hypothetical protein
MMRDPSIRFEDVLDNCITAIKERGNTVADCLARYPARRKELEPLLRLTIRLQVARTLQAPPEFRRAAAIRVHNLITARPHRIERAAVRPNPLHHVQRGLRAISRTHRRLPATVAVSVVLAFWLLVGRGAVYASAGALPGDALYRVKSAVEAVRLAVSLNDASDARLRLDFAARRLDEVAALLEEDRPQDIGQALTDYEAQIESVLIVFGEDSDLLFDEQIVLADLLIADQVHHEARLTVLLNQVPEAVRPATQQALIASRAARDRALQAVGGGPGGPEDLLEPLEGTPTRLPEPSLQPPTGAPEPTPRPTQTPVPTPLPEPSATPTTPPSLEPSEWPTPSATLEWPTPELPTLEWPTPELPTLEWPTPELPTPEWPPEWPIPEWPTPELPTPEWPPEWPIPEWPPEWPAPEWPPEWPIPEWPPEWPIPEWPPEWPTPEWPPG